MPMQKISILLIDLDSICDCNELSKIKAMNVSFITFGNINVMDSSERHIDMSANQVFFYMSDFLHRVRELSPNICFTELAVVSKNETLLSAFMKYRIFTIRYLIEDGAGDSSFVKGGFEQYGHLADIQINNIDDLPYCITSRYKGYVSEIISEPFKVTLNKENDLLFCETTRRVIADDYIVDYIIGGRYFNYRDSRHFHHPLSVRIIKSKKDYVSQQPVFYPIYKMLISVVKNKHLIDFITSIPARPGCEDRFAYYTEKMSEEYGIEYKNNLLCCNTDYKSQKTLNQTMRKQNLIGVFECRKNLTGKNVVLIDDVLTTGATTTAAAEALYKAGAATVSVVVLAVNQFEDNTNHPVKLLCKECEDGVLILKIGTNGLFWGCNSYPSCKESRSYNDGECLLKEQIESSIRKL